MKKNSDVEVIMKKLARLDGRLVYGDKSAISNAAGFNYNTICKYFKGRGDNAATGMKILIATNELIEQRTQLIES